MKKKNEIYLEKRGLISYIVAIVAIVFLLVIAISVPVPLVIFTSTIAISAVVLITFASFYEFRDEYLYIRNGFLVNKIYYNKIKKIGDCKKILKLSDKWIKNRVYINHGESFTMGCTYIIPRDVKKFKKQLQDKIDSQKGEITYDKKVRKNGINNRKHK